MNAQKALDLIKDIPKEDFIKFSFTNGIDKCCTTGHLCRLTSGKPDDYSLKNCTGENNQELMGFRISIMDFMKSRYGNQVGLIFINDNCNSILEVKQKIIYLFKDMIKDGY